MDTGSASTSNLLQRLLPGDPSVFAHAKRTAALALEVAAELRIDARLHPVLEQAALLHHAPLPVEGRGGFYASKPAGPWSRQGRSDEAGAVRTVLAHFHGIPVEQADPLDVMLGGILKTCDVFDQRLERLPSEGTTVEGILNEMWARAEAGELRTEAAAALQVCSADVLSEFGDLPSRLAVNPAAADRVRRLLFMDRQCDPGRLESIAKDDAVLAGAVIRAANSSLYNPAMRISRLSLAISFMGSENTRNTMVAAVLRPLFVSAGLRRLWGHALQMAQFCEALAAASGKVQVEEAFLLGLVHDIGRLAIEHLPRVLVSRFARLVEHGCPPVHAELCVFQNEHGQIGNAVLRAWGFPEHISEAILHHHQPERSDAKLASFLYLAESIKGAEEDIPSPARVKACLERTGINGDTLRALSLAGRSLATILESHG